MTPLNSAYVCLELVELLEVTGRTVLLLCCFRAGLADPDSGCAVQGGPVTDQTTHEATDTRCSCLPGAAVQIHVGPSNAPARCPVATPALDWLWVRIELLRMMFV